MVAGDGAAMLSGFSPIYFLTRAGTKAEAATIRAAFEQEGSLSAGIKLRRLFRARYPKIRHSVRGILGNEWRHSNRFCYD